MTLLSASFWIEGASFLGEINNEKADINRGSCTFTHLLTITGQTFNCTVNL